MSPGSRPRPSLSVLVLCDRLAKTERVAGVSAPAFVERVRLDSYSSVSGGVAGVSAPAFVERRPPRPSTRIARGCRRGLGPGLR